MSEDDKARIASAIEALKHLEKYGKNCDVRFIARGAREELEAIDGIVNNF